jgi:hypothetical protein
MRKLALIAVLCMAALALPGVAKAWKPYTHNYTGTQARADAVDGAITLGGRSYPVPAPVRQALENWPSYYNAGVVGPDGFPDLTMGQSEIHPVRTGAWLKYILDRAWAAQTDPAYNATEREQILAFGYGFLTHAAGDMWAHTLVNEFARGVFPGVGEIVSNSTDAEIAIRHLIVEGYIGNATPGFDNNDNRTTLPDGDVSDDSSPGVAYDAPVRWIYQTLVRPDQPDAPSTNRGPIINFFWGLQGDLQVEKAKLDFDKNWTDCAIIDPDCYEITHTITVNTMLGVRHADVVRQECIGATIGCLISLLDVADDLIINNIGSAYIGAWVDDIQSGLESWGNLGLASTRALFDPQTRRDVQNEECHTFGAETSLPRINCENGIGALDTLFEVMTPFMNNHLLSMLGAPDLVGDINELLGIIGDALDEILGPALNPLRLIGAELKQAAENLIKDLIEEAYGVDVDQLSEFLTNPTHWLNITDVTLTLPVVGSTTVHLFDPWVHPRLDLYMHLPTEHHEGGGISTELSDATEFSPTDFAAIRDTITMAKLLLLSPGELNHALGDSLADQGIIKSAGSIQTYGSGANVMYTPLSGTEPWLQLIDGDHSWRQDGLPVFCDHDKPATCALGIGPDRPSGALDRGTGESQKNAGNGKFPMWESCLLRPAFRATFVDWENNAQQFPDLGDGTSPDPSDPNAPDPDLALTAPAGHIFTSPGGTVYAAADHTFTATATEAVFADAHVQMQYRYFLASGAAPGAESGWTAIAGGGTFQITGADGLYKVQVRSADPCHTFATGDALPAGAPETREVFLDATPPDITVSSPANGALFDTDDFSTINWSATDSGSGVASQSGTFDGAATTNGATLDMFYLYPGAHTVTVNAADNVGNTATKSNVFQLHATSLSLLHNVQRACGESGDWPATPTLITKAGVCAAMKAILAQAVTKHASGDHATERNIVAGWVEDVQAQRGKAVDTATADRFIAYGNDLVATGG